MARARRTEEIPRQTEVEVEPGPRRRRAVPGRRRERHEPTTETMQAWNAPWARQDVDAQLQRVERRMQRIFRAADTLADGQTLVYGWTVAAGPDGEPHVSEFGNIDLSRRGLEQGWRSPNVRYRTDPEARTLHLEFDLPGVPRDAIQLAVAEDEIHVSAASGDRRYRSTIPLTGTVDPDSADATYRDGVLELEIRAEAAPERHRRDVRVR